jgi:hypothetical protein
MRCFAEPSLTELLSEPIVRQLMARDGTSERQVRAIATLARRRIELQRKQSLVSNEPLPALLRHQQRHVEQQMGVPLQLVTWDKRRPDKDADYEATPNSVAMRSR